MCVWSSRRGRACKRAQCLGRNASKNRKGTGHRGNWISSFGWRQGGGGVGGGFRTRQRGCRRTRRVADPLPPFFCRRCERAVQGASPGTHMVRFLYQTACARRRQGKCIIEKYEKRPGAPPSAGGGGGRGGACPVRTVRFFVCAWQERERALCRRREREREEKELENSCRSECEVRCWGINTPGKLERQRERKRSRPRQCAAAGGPHKNRGICAAVCMRGC